MCMFYLVSVVDVNASRLEKTLQPGQVVVCNQIGDGAVADGRHGRVRGRGEGLQHQKLHHHNRAKTELETVNRCVACDEFGAGCCAVKTQTERGLVKMLIMGHTIKVRGFMKESDVTHEVSDWVLRTHSLFLFLHRQADRRTQEIDLRREAAQTEAEAATRAVAIARGAKGG
jgi:transcription elongation factor Elf1